MSAVATVDTERVKQGIDLREMAGRLTELRRESASELAGPCPKCGGTDRFHVKADGFFCRQCHERWGDAIEFEQWLHGVGFREAVTRLTGGQALPQVQPKQPATKPARSPAWVQERAERLVAEAQAALWRSPDAEPGRAYLLSRALEPHTWQQFGLGYSASVAVPGTEGKQRAPAITMPWYAAGTLRGVRFRFLEPHNGHKQTALHGGRFGGLLFGGQALLGFVSLSLPEFGRPVEALRTLVLCEGEINCMSIWQVAHESLVDVLSIGSESARLTDAMVKLAQRYSVVLVWADKSEVARRQALELGAHAISSPGGQDANDLLRAGHLGGLLATARLRACQGREQRQALFWALWDSVDSVQGIDGGSASVLRRLASELGQQVALVEAEPGRWLTER